MSTSAKHFLRHYGEMVVAMFLGMAILGFPVDRLMSSAGADSDAFMFLGMATTMTVPMVGWMAYRGHGWRANAEMSASMFLPTFAVMALMGLGAVDFWRAMMVIEHVAMLLAMFAVMAARPREYAHGHHAHAHGHTPAAAHAPAEAVSAEP